MKAHELVVGDKFHHRIGRYIVTRAPSILPVPTIEGHAQKIVFWHGAGASGEDRQFCVTFGCEEVFGFSLE